MQRVKRVAFHAEAYSVMSVRLANLDGTCLSEFIVTLATFLAKPAPMGILATLASQGTNSSIPYVFSLANFLARHANFIQPLAHHVLADTNWTAAIA